MSSDQPRLLGIYGGSFDPVHLGHIAVADLAYRQLALSELRFMPCKHPPHKPGLHASDDQRVAMLQRALADTDYTIECLELEAEGVSYTVNSLKALRSRLDQQGEAHTHIVLIMGSDSFQQLTTWWCWRLLPELAHIAVVMRPGSAMTIDAERNESMARGQVGDLSAHKSGKVVMLASSEVSISSSQLRAALGSPALAKAGEAVDLGEARGDIVSNLHPRVADYIEQNRLYNVDRQTI